MAALGGPTSPTASAPAAPPPDVWPPGGPPAPPAGAPAAPPQSAWQPAPAAGAPAAPPQSEAEALCAELSARDDLRRAPDVIDAALELLQKWPSSYGGGNACVNLITAQLIRIFNVPNLILSHY